MMRYAITTLALALTMHGGLAAEPAQTTAPVKIKPKAAPVKIVQSSLEVRDFSGDFTQWKPVGAIGAGSLTKEFRWRVKLTGAVSARYELTYSPLPVWSTFLPAPVKQSAQLTLPAAPDAFSYFTINFTPHLHEISGTSTPTASVTFYVRVVPLDALGKELSPLANPVSVVYSPPAGGSRLAQSMTLRLTSVVCKETTGGADQLAIDIRGGLPTDSGFAKILHQQIQEMDEGDKIDPMKNLWEYTGSGFTKEGISKEVIIAVALADIDNPLGEGFPKSGTGVQNTGTLIGALLKGLQRVVCNDENNDDCIGPAQFLPVTQSDWNAAVTNGKTVKKTLVFTGEGSKYEMTFELSRP